MQGWKVEPDKVQRIMWHCLRDIVSRFDRLVQTDGQTDPGPYHTASMASRD